jgi:hypothetical protein
MGLLLWIGVQQERTSCTPSIHTHRHKGMFIEDYTRLGHQIKLSCNVFFFAASSMYNVHEKFYR